MSWPVDNVTEFFNQYRAYEEIQRIQRADIDSQYYSRPTTRNLPTLCKSLTLVSNIRLSQFTTLRSESGFQPKRARLGR